MTHAALSPSARHRWSRCPASVKALTQYPERKSSAVAIDGTHSHTVLEHCLKNDITPDLLIGMDMKDDDGSFTVDRERAERVKVAVDYVRSRVAWFGPEAKYHSEMQATPAALIGREDMSGTVDVHIVAGRTLEVIDYKDGGSPVSPVNNPQLEQYGVALLAHYGQDQFDEVILTIIQPKLSIPITSWAISTAGLLDALVKMVGEAAATDDPDAPFVPGEVQCKYCAHKINCRAHIDHTLSAAGIEFENLELAKQAAEKQPEELTDDELRQIIESAPLLRKLIEAAEAEAIRRIQIAHPVPGLKLVHGRGSRSWRDESAVEGALKKMHVPKTAIWKTSIVSPAQVEKLRWKKRDGTEVQLTPKQLALLESEYISRSEGKLTVVSEADHRPAVVVQSIGEMFSPVDEVPSWMS